MDCKIWIDYPIKFNVDYYMTENIHESKKKGGNLSKQKWVRCHTKLGLKKQDLVSFYWLVAFRPCRFLVQWIWMEERSVSWKPFVAPFKSDTLVSQNRKQMWNFLKFRRRIIECWYLSFTWQVSSTCFIFTWIQEYFVFIQFWILTFAY